MIIGSLTRNIFLYPLRIAGLRRFGKGLFSSKSAAALFLKDVQLHPALAVSLRENKILEPTEIQSKSLPFTIDGENSVITAETGSGKTLCYLLPILNDIFKERLKIKGDKSAMVIDDRQPRGAIILVPTKELAAQVLSMINKLDKKNVVRMQRATSISHIASSQPEKLEVTATTATAATSTTAAAAATATTKTGVVQNKTRASSSLSFENVARSVNWSETDVIVATPTQLEPILLLKDRVNPYDVDPKIIVIDEFDLLLGDTNVAKSTLAIIDRFSSLKKNPMNEMRQFICTAASLPKKIQREDTSTFLARVLRTPMSFQSSQFYKLSGKMKHVSIRVAEYLQTNSKLKEIDILLQVITKSTAQKIIIFTGKSETSVELATSLKQAGVKSAAFHAKLPTEKRLEALQSLEAGTVRVLVSTDLGCRGLDFSRVDHVIQFDFALDAVSFLHRVGRTCRMGETGLVTSFVRPQDEFFYRRVQEIIENNTSIEPIISRKRSLSKGARDQSSSDEEDSEQTK